MSIATHHYNPDWLSDDALVAGFIARQTEFRFLRDELARAPLEGSVQHYLLIGLRGAGKTTLLKRLAVAIRRDTDLADHLIALSFPEELYQVKDLADFWWAACEALVDELDRQGRRADADALMDRTDAARAAARRGDQPADAGLALLLDTCARLQRRPVMLVDNLDMVFERIDKRGRKLKDPHAAAYWALREALSTTRSPIVIGGSVRLSEPFTDYDKAFYDFFVPKRLGRLELAEVRQVLEHLADRQGSPEIKARLKARPSRIETLHDLTGGNPRAVGLIFTLLQQGPNSRAVEDFERLMDLTTPYYKARFEDLSEQAQVVMHALAVRRPGDGSGLRFGHTAAELGAHAGLPTNVVSAQLDVLEREGLLEKSAAFGRTQYRIAEQLFRLWLQMRGNRRVRQSALGLTEFLEAMYDEEELTATLQGATGPALAEARLAFAMADMRGRRADRRSLEAWGADCAARYAAESGAEMNEVLPSCDLSEELATLKALRARLAGCTGHDLTPAEQDAL
nr:AAA family ATPase [Zoogloea sp.]